MDFNPSELGIRIVTGIAGLALVVASASLGWSALRAYRSATAEPDGPDTTVLIEVERDDGSRVTLPLDPTDEESIRQFLARARGEPAATG